MFQANAQVFCDFHTVLHIVINHCCLLILRICTGCMAQWLEQCTTVKPFTLRCVGSNPTVSQGNGLEQAAQKYSLRNIHSRLSCKRVPGFVPGEDWQTVATQ